MKTTDPEGYMGVFKRLDDVSDRYRLHHHEDAFEGRDVWADYLAESLFEQVESERFRQHARNVGDEWKEHTVSHHALATPDEVETWFSDLLSRLKTDTVYGRRFVWLEGFFEWLQNHTEYPHVYHPVWMAAADPDAEATGTLWNYKMSNTRNK